ncbi:unnamed protein product [Ceratitis capitata]|uniref:(Mediterranean fruit fly) hypothetical protein n=1 Tax=Ceratitis capitata TaxID=7213 RepID=A0A811UXA4_CERCA|nr:unnamed protein product [Ceratitis capitata]
MLNKLVSLFYKCHCIRQSSSLSLPSLLTNARVGGFIFIVAIANQILFMYLFAFVDVCVLIRKNMFVCMYFVAHLWLVMLLTALFSKRAASVSFESRDCG